MNEWTLFDACAWFVFFCLAGCLGAVLLVLLRRFAPDWLRNSKLGEDLGLAPDEPDEITAADVMRWNARNVPAKDNDK